MGADPASNRVRWPRRKPRCWQCLATISPADPYCPCCGANPNEVRTRPRSRRGDGGGLANGATIMVFILAMFGAAGFAFSNMRDSAGSGSARLGASTRGHPTATARTLAPTLTDHPTPTSAPDQRKRRAPRGIPADAVLGIISAIRTGDTFEIAVGGRAFLTHLAGVDAPEPTSTVPGECYGDEAKDRLGDLVVVGMPIWVSPDPAKLPTTATFEGYAWTWDILGRNPRFVNEVLVRGGYARYAPPAPDMGYDEPARLRDAQAEATGGRQGLWGGCP